jgi:hypothetical protein
MFSVEADNSNRLIKISWSENVSADEMRECAEQLRALTADMKPLRLNPLTASQRRLCLGDQGRGRQNEGHAPG